MFEAWLPDADFIPPDGKWRSHPDALVSALNGELIAFVEEFAGLGVHFHLPLKTYSSGMKSRLAFGTSMGIAFDTYLVDEVTAVGDASFRARSDALFKQRMRNAGSVVVSHSMNQIRQLCDAVVILEDGHLVFHDDVDRGIREHEQNMKRRG